MIFSNKYINYSSRTKKELRQALILFSILSNKIAVIIGKYLLNITLKLHLPVLGLIKKIVFPSFCGGENITETKQKITLLGQDNIKTLLAYSVEGKGDHQSFRNTYEEILKNLDESQHNELVPFCVFKITGIARFDILKKINEKAQLSTEEEEEVEKIKTRLHHICQKANNIKIPVLIDAEESWIQNAIDQFVEEMMAIYNKIDVIVYHTIQLYRWDKFNYIKQLHEISKKKNFKLGLKLVRGAYMEKERARSKRKKYTSPIHKQKTDCDYDYNEASKYCINHIEKMSLCFGTHNERSTQMIIQLMKKNRISNNDKRIYFSHLLGMSDNISFYLAHFNYNVTKYVPYGPVKEVLPYLIRRVEENSAITGQTNQEIKRLEEALKKYY